MWRAECDLGVVSGLVCDRVLLADLVEVAGKGRPDADECIGQDYRRHYVN